MTYFAAKMNKRELVCIRCNKPVKEHKAQYNTFEKMHWLCFHLEFEHKGDPDTACDDPSCPWWHIEVYKLALDRLDEDPETVIESAIKERWNL